MKQPTGTLKEIDKYFDQFAESYDEFAFNQSQGVKFLSNLEIKFVLENCPRRMNGKRVLDIGVGTGRFSELLINKGAIIDGVDFSKKMIEQTKKKLRGKPITLKFADVGKRIPYSNNIFDYVICIRVLKYIKNWKKTIKEVSRVLKKDGIFIFDIANLYSIAYLGSKNVNYFLLKLGDVKKVLKNEGFKIVDIKTGSRLPFLLYRKVNSSFILNILKTLEWLFDRFLPKIVLPRNILIAAKKVE